MKPNLRIMGIIVSVIGSSIIGFGAILDLIHNYVPAGAYLIGVVLDLIGLVLTVKNNETKQTPS